MFYAALTPLPLYVCCCMYYGLFVAPKKREAKERAEKEAREKEMREKGIDPNAIPANQPQNFNQGQMQNQAFGQGQAMQGVPPYGQQQM